MERIVDNQPSQFVAFTLETARNAARDYFEPVVRLVKGVRFNYLLPRLVIFLESLEERFDSPGQYYRLIQSYRVLAHAMARRGDTESATEVVSLLCSMAERGTIPSASYACFNFGELLFGQSHLEQAQVFFNKVIELNEPEDLVAAACARLAQIFNSQGHFDKTIFSAQRSKTIFQRLDKLESFIETKFQVARALSAQGQNQRMAQVRDQVMQPSIRVGQLLLPWYARPARTGTELFNPSSSPKEPVQAPLA